VHNFKNAYNNFHNRRDFVVPAFRGEQKETVDGNEPVVEKFLKPSFLHLEELFDLELGKPLKLAYRLSDKVLHPTNIEKTNVGLADSIFHDYYSGSFALCKNWRRKK